MTDRKLEIGGGRRIGNPRAFPGEGRLLKPDPGGAGAVADVRSGIATIERLDDDNGEGPTPFFPATISGEGPYTVTINPGAVGFWEPKAGEDTLYFEIPEIDGVPIDTSPAPEISVPAGEWVCVKVLVDGRNQSRETPFIVVGENDGIHYIPEVADTSAEDGEYYIKLFKIDVVDETLVVSHRVWSDPILSPFLWPGSNEGGGPGRVLKDYDADDHKYRFRTLDYGYGTTVVETGDIIRPRLKAESVGTGAEIYVAPSDPVVDEDPGRFNTIAGRQSPDPIAPQIQVDPAEPPVGANPGKPIIVRGNGNQGALVFTKDGTEVGRVEWSDGLWTSPNDVTIELCCSSGTAAPGP